MKIYSYIITYSLLIFMSTTVPAHEIGEYFQGGIIFWIEKTDTQERGLIATSADQIRNTTWANRVYATGATKDGLLAGKENTKIIIDKLGPSGNYAAKMAAASRDGGYSDWYLPSKYELNLLFNQHFIVGEFSTDRDANGSGCNKYWSSTETQTGKAWSQSFDSGTTNETNACGLGGASGNVRAIRSYQEVHTTYECSIVQGVIKEAATTCGKWNNYTTRYDTACSGLVNKSTDKAIFECTVRNGSILVSSSQLLTDPTTNKSYNNVLLTNETKYFPGGATKYDRSLVYIGATFVTPK